MNPVRWDVLGTAAIAKSRFIPAMQGADSARLVAVASRDADKAQAVAEAFGSLGFRHAPDLRPCVRPQTST